jgi:hypothetical protein
MIKDLYDIMDERQRMSTKKESDKTITRASGADDILKPIFYMKVVLPIDT